MSVVYIISASVVCCKGINNWTEWQQRDYIDRVQLSASESMPTPYNSEASFRRVNLSAMYFTPSYLHTNASYHRSNVDYYCINESHKQNNAIRNSVIPRFTVGP